MLSNQQREFRRLGLNVLFRLMKFHGHLVWLLEKNQFGGELVGEDVDALYERLYNVTDAIDAFRRSQKWRSVDDVEPSDEGEEL